MRDYGCDYKTLLNPLMVMCYHPICLAKKRPPVRLIRMSKIEVFLDHIKDHSDPISTAMQRILNTVAVDPFTTKERLDEISMSTHYMNNLGSLAEGNP